MHNHVEFSSREVQRAVGQQSFFEGVGIKSQVEVSLRKK